MWNVVLQGAALVIGITYLLRIEPSIQFILTGCFAMFIGLVVFVIACLDRPLSGPLAIDSRPYRIVRDGLMDLDANRSSPDQPVIHGKVAGPGELRT
jgi:hypothetical protein